jgi:hypothetical protein
MFWTNNYNQWTKNDVPGNLSKKRYLCMYWFVHLFMSIQGSRYWVSVYCVTRVVTVKHLASLMLLDHVWQGITVHEAPRTPTLPVRQ